MRTTTPYIPFTSAAFARRSQACVSSIMGGL